MKKSKLQIKIEDEIKELNILLESTKIKNRALVSTMQSLGDRIDLLVGLLNNEE